MSIGSADLWHWLAMFQHELLLFAGVFFLIGALDDLAVDALWLVVPFGLAIALAAFAASVMSTPWLREAKVYGPVPTGASERSATSWYSVPWKVAAATTRIAALMKSALESATVESIVA